LPHRAIGILQCIVFAYIAIEKYDLHFRKISLKFAVRKENNNESFAQDQYHYRPFALCVDGTNEHRGHSIKSGTPIANLARGVGTQPSREHIQQWQGLVVLDSLVGRNSDDGVAGGASDTTLEGDRRILLQAHPNEMASRNNIYGTDFAIGSIGGTLAVCDIVESEKQF
jgi:hypothetical protein